jgi:hypothetical protein
MNDRDVANVLDEHSSRLLAGRDDSLDLMAGFQLPDRASLDSLLKVARRVKAALVPVDARPEFAAGLRQQLVAAMPAAGRAPRRAGRLMWVAGAGGVLYLVGLTFISFRAGAAAMGKLSGIIAAGRASRTAVPEAQPAP